MTAQGPTLRHGKFFRIGQLGQGGWEWGRSGAGEWGVLRSIARYFGLLQDCPSARLLPAEISPYTEVGSGSLGGGETRGW